LVISEFFWLFHGRSRHHPNYLDPPIRIHYALHEHMRETYYMSLLVIKLRTG
jgi:hypothetical protein